MPKSVLSVFANVINYFYEDFTVKKKESKYCTDFLGYKIININSLQIIIVELYTTDSIGTVYNVTVIHFQIMAI